MINEKENVRRYYAHELPDHYAVLEKGLHTIVPMIHIRPIMGAHKDWFGCNYSYDANIKKWSVPCDPRVVTDITKWREQVVFPDLESIDWAALAAKEVPSEEVRKEKAISVLLQCGVYERFHALLGMEEAMIALLTEPEASKELLDAIGDFRCRLIGKFIEYYKPDIIRNHDDYGTQFAMQISPDLWREMIKPQLKKIADLCHSNGVFYEQHSCGIVEPIVKDMMEVGVDSVQAMHINDVPKLKVETGTGILYHMSLNVPDYLVADMAGTLTEEWLRKDVHDTLWACAPGGAYFHTPVSVVGAPADWWVYKVIAEEIEKFRAEFSY